MRLGLVSLLAFGLAAGSCKPAPCQTYAVGADVSFLGKCEQDGVVFKENGQAKDVLAMLREHQYNWVRLRLFHDPAASSDKLPNDLPYTLVLAARARAMGFHVLLDLHYSDSWADPGKQPMPAAWSNLSHEQLVDEVFRYTRDVVTAFARKGLIPDMVAGRQSGDLRHALARRQGARPLGQFCRPAEGGYSWRGCRQRPTAKDRCQAAHVIGAGWPISIGPKDLIWGIGQGSEPLAM